MNFFQSILVLTFCLVNISSATNDRQNLRTSATAMITTPEERELTDDYKYSVFQLQNKKAGVGYKLGYRNDGNRKRGSITDDDDKHLSFIYRDDFHLEVYNLNGYCYEMKPDYQIYLEPCDTEIGGQKWILSRAPEPYGYFYIVSNVYYGYVLDYSSSNRFNLKSKDWKEVDFFDKDEIDEVLFYRLSIYTHYDDRACRTSSGGKGTSGRDFVTFENVNRQDCGELCDKDYKCQALEYSSGRCEIWYTRPSKLEHVNGMDCYLKKFD